MGSYDFRNSVSDGLGDGTNGGVDLSIDTYTLMAWVKLNTVGGNGQGRVMGRNLSTTPTESHMTLMTATNTGFGVARQARGAGVDDITLGSAWSFATGMIQWNCYLGTYDAARSGRWQTFLDGVQSNGTTSDQAGTIEHRELNEWMLGRVFNVTTRSFDGLMAHVCVWNRVLTAQEIADLAAGGNPLDVAASGLIRYWPMNVNENPVVDVQGSSHDLNWVGSVSFEVADEPPVDPPPGAEDPPNLQAPVTDDDVALTWDPSF